MAFPEGQQFLSVRHIFENYQPSDHDRLNPQETDDELWSRKKAFAGVRGLEKDIKKNGIQVPISLGYFKVELIFDSNFFKLNSI
jgi:hypothetical protein